MVGMSALEGDPRGFWDALEFAGETLSTTGYGRDTRWSHPAMVIYVIVLQFVGVFLMFLIVPLYLVPFLEERFEERLPTAAPDGIEDHAVIYHYGPAVENLIEQLIASARPFFVVETDEATARGLIERRIPVVFSRADEDVLEHCRLDTAKAIVANGRDEENVGVILRARQLGFDGDILSLADDPVRRRPMELAGATGVFTPNHILAAALAARASDRISPTISGVNQIGELELREVRIEPGSSLAGKTLAQAAIGKRTGATILGQWVGAKLDTRPDPSTRLVPGGIVIVVGGRDSIKRLEDLAEGAQALRREGPFIVAGFGEVGHKVHQLLTDVGEDVFTIDRDSKNGVNLVGNVLDTEVLHQAGVANARSVILALDSDESTLFAAVIVRDLVPHIPIIARVNKARNVENIHRAGADFALSISQVSGQILSHRFVKTESRALGQHLSVLQWPQTGFDGVHPSQLEVRERTGCSVVAVQRAEFTILTIDSEFRFEPGDVVFVCGDPEALDRFREIFPSPKN